MCSTGYHTLDASFIAIDGKEIFAFKYICMRYRWIFILKLKNLKFWKQKTNGMYNMWAYSHHFNLHITELYQIYVARYILKRWYLEFPNIWVTLKWTAYEQQLYITFGNNIVVSQSFIKSYQKYEVMKTEDIPNLENSSFDPNEVLDIAQNIMSFIKRNAAVEGHTYWLYKSMSFWSTVEFLEIRSCEENLWIECWKY